MNSAELLCRTAFVGLLGAAGCYTTTLQSGLPAAPPAFAYDEKWHSGVVLGIAELSGPYDLQKICPTGWAQIKTETSFVNGIVELVTSGIYSPQTVTIRCATSPVPTPQPQARK
jgi:Bor protein